MKNINLRYKKNISKAFLYIGLLVLVVIWSIPILNIFLTSIKSKADYFSGMGLFELPDKIHWQNYIDAWQIGRLGMYMKNGLFVAIIKLPLGIFIEAMAAFALTRLPIKKKR